MKAVTYRMLYCRLADCYDGAKAIRMRRTKKDKNVKKSSVHKGFNDI